MTATYAAALQLLPSTTATYTVRCNKKENKKTIAKSIHVHEQTYPHTAKKNIYAASHAIRTASYIQYITYNRRSIHYMSSRRLLALSAARGVETQVTEGQNEVRHMTNPQKDEGRVYSTCPHGDACRVRVATERRALVQNHRIHEVNCSNKNLCSRSLSQNDDFFNVTWRRHTVRLLSI